VARILGPVRTSARNSVAPAQLAAVGPSVYAHCHSISVDKRSRAQSGVPTDMKRSGSTTLHTLLSRAQVLPRSHAAAASLAPLLLAAGAAAAPRRVHAAAPNSTVTSLADVHLMGDNTCVSTTTGGDCTLRAATELSDANGGGSTIRPNLPTPGQSWRFA
jgi:hypothetical protein